MLTQLTIRNIALIEQLDLEFGNGMTTLTGETGAGKSILIDAIGLIRGERAQTGLIRAGQDEAEVIAAFDYANDSNTAEFLREQGLDDGELIIRRVLGADGRSKTWINGRPTPLAVLKSLSALLIDVHGQHQNQKLLESGYQRQLLDAYAGHLDQCAELARTARQLREQQQQLERLRQDQQTRDDRRALLDFQLEEIEQIAPQPDEINQLHQQLTLLSREDEWRQTLAEQLDQLYDGDDSLNDRLGRSIHALERLLEIDETLPPILEALETARIQIDESADSLRTRLESGESDPGRLDEVQRRLDALHQLARKHRIAPEMLDEHIAALKTEAEELTRASDDLGQLDASIAELTERYDSLATKIGSQRHLAAEKLGAIATESIRELGMPHGVLRIDVNALPEDDERRPETGREEVVFQISANRGQPPQPLNKIASGGELARVSLALKSLTASFDPVETFIFDEVDTGIGGAIAEIVGRHLRTLANQRQVFCVTHLPQVAAQGHHQYRVSKDHEVEHTVTTIDQLDADERVEELARMMGGVNVTDQTRALAREMIAGTN